MNNNTTMGNGSAGEGDTQQYWERLRILRARCGLENTEGASEQTRTVSALQQGVRLTDSSSSLSSNSSGGLVSFVHMCKVSMVKAVMCEIGKT